MSVEDDFQSRLKDLDGKIESLKGSNTKKLITKQSGLGGEKVFAELIAGILFGLFVGFWLDDYFDTKPLFILLLIILGLAASFYNIYKEAVKEDINEE